MVLFFVAVLVAITMVPASNVHAQDEPVALAGGIGLQTSFADLCKAGEEGQERVIASLKELMGLGAEVKLDIGNLTSSTGDECPACGDLSTDALGLAPDLCEKPVKTSTTTITPTAATSILPNISITTTTTTTTIEPYTSNTTIIDPYNSTTSNETDEEGPSRPAYSTANGTNKHLKRYVGQCQGGGPACHLSASTATGLAVAGYTGNDAYQALCEATTYCTAVQLPTTREDLCTRLYRQASQATRPVVGKSSIVGPVGMGTQP